MAVKERIPAKVPQEMRPIRKGSRWQERCYTLIPGYVFVGCEDINAEMYYTVRSISSVLRFLGTPKPHPITEQEAVYIDLLAPSNEPLCPSLVEVKNGTPIIINGILAKIPGRVTKYCLRQRRAQATLSILGEKKTVQLAIEVAGTGDDGGP